ncbi:MAG: quinone oxidoreductase [Mycobacterium sp.]|jgi:putative PIG3 family NAD(P)H quinone oxidoreductase|nr:quinone oxidoreductase [Mycobacterium sp.]
MHAIVIREPGGPEVLEWAEVPDPAPGSGEVLIDVVASAVNRADIMQRQGHYPPPPGAPDIPGLECSGRIAELGRGVTGWNVGDEVCALLSGGGYAEKVVAPVGQLLPVPRGIELHEGGALPEAACTVWSNVFDIAHLSPGEILLVHGGASGIGTFAIQLATAYGARVFTTASKAKHERLVAYGADRAVDYRDEDFVEIVRTETGGYGADVVLDNMGAKYLARNVDVLARNGRLMTIGLQGGRKAELDLAALLGKCGSVAATSLRSRPAAEKARIVADVRENVWPAIEAGTVRPVVDRVFAMQDAAEAHRYLDSGEHIGKVLLVR